MEENKKFSTNEVYRIYRSQISDMIAYIEVYEHDLPPLITGLISEMFSAIAVSSLPGMRESDGLDYCIQNVVLIIRLHTIFAFIHEIGEKENLFKNYQYKGAMIPGTDMHIFDEVERKKKKATHDLVEKLKKYYRSSMKSMFYMILDTESAYGLREFLLFLGDYVKLYKCRRLSKWKKPFIPVELLTVVPFENTDLSEDYENFKELLLFCEKHMSDVINTGPKASLKKSLFVAITSWIIPFYIGIPAAKYLLKGVVHLFDLFRNLLKF